MKVVIGEDEALLRRGLMLVLENAGIVVAAAAQDAVDLVALVDEHRPDLVITDVRMPPTHTDEGMVAALQITRRFPDMAVVVLSQYVQRRYAVELLSEKRRGVGYLLKQRIADVDTFCADLHRIHAGGAVIDPEVVAIMVARARQDDGPIARLTPRQRQVLTLVAEGRSNSSIAAELVVTEKAVVQHTSRIYDALGLAADDDGHRRVLAVLKYLARE
ncbi:response regulator transcription factor [Nakamurella flavida]|uniref:Response regulator transcription factor n=1 Tax=Nakamurella flavida TaxID=363630 RepID=A0A938YIJ6_9ACTN|nr:response regulator transcription factor [Nakamurella flavida]MBM9476602.1 response regulator transcription factor [Nakamurella flavida]MDP9778960.1 DNA-binding NarL/FixJ family response regulator [Nakamurella flavida]